ncbi:MAG: helix-turn-helix domain-containing protein [Acutalibacteraceae bacterium]
MELISNPKDIRILGVYEISRTQRRWMTEKRNISVLSCRLRGEAEFYFKGEKYVVGTNDLLYIPANIEYSQVSRGENLIAVHFMANDCLDRDIKVIKSQDNRFAQDFKNICRSWAEETAEGRYLAVSMFYNLLSRLSAKVSEKSSGRISAGINYIKNNYRSSALTVSDAAREAFVSEVFFRRILKRETGMSPIKYINHLRIEAAKELLLGNYYSVSEIAYMCGFSDVKYFSHVFKQMTGMTPTQYINSKLQ